MGKTSFPVIEGAKGAAPYTALADAQTAGAVTVNYGLFFNAVISFLIVAFAVFMLIKGINSLKREEEAPPAEPPSAPEPPPTDSPPGEPVEEPTESEILPST